MEQKRYRLKKDLPYFKAGQIVLIEIEIEEDGLLKGRKIARSYWEYEDGDWSNLR